MVLELDLQQCLELSPSAMGDMLTGIDFVRVAYGSLSAGRTGESVIRFAHQDQNVRHFLTTLTNEGFYVYKADESSSSLVRHGRIPSLWHRVRSGDFLATEAGTVFRVDPPRNGCRAASLLVVFSSMAEGLFSASLMRYFEQNYRSISKYVSDDTVVLRVADIGGVVGAFYMDTVAMPRNVELVQCLIEEVRAAYGVTRGRTVLYGASKGGTGALAHGLVGDYRFVSVDPIVDDAYYEEEFADSHFTGTGIFLHRKAEFFANLALGIGGSAWADRGLGVIVTSPQSPQYAAIRALPGKIIDASLMVESVHPEIKDHPDVSRRTLHIATAAINWMSSGLGKVYPGSVEVC